VSEARVRLASGRVKWVRRSRENHFLDCEAMMMAAAHFINAGRIPMAHASPPPAPAAPSTPGVVPEDPTKPIAKDYWEEHTRRAIEHAEKVAAENRSKFLDPHGLRNKADFWDKDN
jgi:hypothetical protein